MNLDGTYLSMLRLINPFLLENRTCDLNQPGFGTYYILKTNVVKYGGLNLKIRFFKLEKEKTSKDFTIGFYYTIILL